MRVFGSINRTLSASDRQLVEACGEDADVARFITAARALIEAGLREGITRSRVDCHDVTLERYLVHKFRQRPVEELHAIFVDSNDGFISDEMIASGLSDHVEASLSHIMRRTLELGASGIILLHNHPSNSAEPSVEDIRSTRIVLSTISSFGVRLIDHLIIAGPKVSSMRKMGFL